MSRGRRSSCLATDRNFAVDKELASDKELSRLLDRDDNVESEREREREKERESDTVDPSWHRRVDAN